MQHSATLWGTIPWPLAALVLAGCGDAGAPMSPARANPTFEIMDAAHGGGNAHFFFLPPIVKDPAATGVFDATLEPVVQICEWTATGCVEPLVVEFSMGSGPGTIQLDPLAEAYFVAWRARDFNLDPAKKYRIRVLVSTQELGHADVQVLSTGRELKNVDTDEFIGLLDNRTLMIRFRIEEGAVRSGGILVMRTREDQINLDIYLMSPDGVEFTQLTDHPCTDYDGDWSPDRARIAFVSYRTSSPQTCAHTDNIYVMNADGTGIMQLTHDPAGDWHPSWSPDGTTIAFSSQRGGRNGEIYVMNADGSGVVRRITSSGRQSFQPVWSPDGTRLAFSSDALSYPNVHEIFVVDPSATEAPPGAWTRITTNEERDLVSGWSPDGTKITFVRGDRWFLDHDVYIMNADGTGAINLSNDPNHDDRGWPAWSPDGSEIAWTKKTGTDGDWQWQVWKMNADGSNPVQLTFGERWTWVTSWR